MRASMAAVSVDCSNRLKMCNPGDGVGMGMGVGIGSCIWVVNARAKAVGMAIRMGSDSGGFGALETPAG